MDEITVQGGVGEAVLDEVETLGDGNVECRCRVDSRALDVRDAPDPMVAREGGDLTGHREAAAA